MKAYLRTALIFLRFDSVFLQKVKDKVIDLALACPNWQYIATCQNLDLHKVGEMKLLNKHDQEWFVPSAVTDWKNDEADKQKKESIKIEKKTRKR